MNFSLHTEDILQLRTDLCVLLCFEDKAGQGTVFQALDRALEELLGRLSAEEQFKGKKGQTLLVHTHGKIGAQRIEGIRHGLQRGERVAAAVARARDLINEPAAVMTPSSLAEVARKLAKEHQLDVKVLGPKECEKAGMGMFLAVARGSEEEP